MMLWAAVVAGAVAAPTRLAVVISANDGLSTDPALLYADHDGDRVARVLVELGGVHEANLFRAPAASVDTVTAALTRAVIRSQALQDAGEETSLVIYYTGHAATDGVHLSGEVLSLPALKTAARVVPARERVFIVDACQAGQILRSKGASLVDVSDRPADFLPPDDEAWIASTGPEERAFEVDQRRGALFTHFFISGARGAADGDRDGEVTLGELYGFVQQQTEVAAATLGVVQRPRWAGQLEDLVISRPGDADSGLEAEGPLPNPLLVVDLRSGTVAAEVPAGAGGRVALPPGHYQLMSLDAERRPGVTQLRVSEGTYAPLRVDALRRVSGVRTKGGLVDPRPWSFSTGYVGLLGATLGRTDAHGVFLGLRRSLGKGHRGEVGVELGRAGWRAARRGGSDRWGGARVQWGFDLRSHGLRGGPAAELDLGLLRQEGERVPDPVWGQWYGDATAPRSSTAGYGRTLAGWSAELPLSSVALTGFVGGGATLHGPDRGPPQPTAQVRLGMAWTP